MSTAAPSAPDPVAAPVRKTKTRKKAAAFVGPASPTHPACLKCKLFQAEGCETPFQDGFHFRGGDVHDGPPPNPADYVLVVGDVPDRTADERGLLESEDVDVIARAARRLGVLDQVWYVPGIKCRPARTDKRDEGRLTKTEIANCWKAHMLPVFERVGRPRALLGVGAVGTYATLGRMDAQKLEGQWHRSFLGMTYGMRSVETLQLNPEATKAEFLEAFGYAFTHREEDISLEIGYVVARTAAEVRAWFAPVLRYFAEYDGPDDLVDPVSWDVESSSVTKRWCGPEHFQIGLWSFDHPLQPLPLLIPTTAYEGDAADPVDEAEEVLIDAVLQPVFESRKVRKVGHNLQFDENAVFACRGWEVQGFLADTQMLDFLMDPDEKRHALDLLCCRYLPEVPRYWEELHSWLAVNHEDVNTHGYNRVPAYVLYPYAAWDTIVVSRLYRILREALRARGEGPLAQGWFVMSAEQPDVSTLTPLQYALHARRVHHHMCTLMERTGIHIDRELVGMARTHYDAIRRGAAAALEKDPDVQRFEAEFLPDRISKSAAAYKQWKKFGTPITINWSSNPQLQMFFLKFMELPVLSRTDTKAPCLDAANIAKYASAHGCQPAARLLEWRKADKFVTSFLDPLLPGPASRVQRDDCVHPGYKSAATATGRLACSGGYNMTAMPRDGAIKKVFNSHHEDGWIVTRDYSGIEVRILAIVSQDPTLCAAFREGRDPHFVTQQFFFKEKADAKNKTQRSICKRALFGRLYGQGDQGLFDLLTSEGIISMDTGLPVTLEECRTFNQLIDQLYPGVSEWVKLAHEQGLGYAHCCSLFGFVRLLPAAKMHKRQQELRARWKSEVLNKVEHGGKSEKDLTPVEAKVRRDYRRISAMVAEVQRFAQNSPIQSSAADLTVMASYVAQKRLQAVDKRMSVVGVVHDDIWLSVPHADLVPESVSILRDTMNNPKEWLPELLPGFKCDWINIPIIGDCDVGLSPKDALACAEEPSRGHSLDPGPMTGELLLSAEAAHVADFGFDARPVPGKPDKVVLEWHANHAAVREYLRYKRQAL